MFEMQDILKGIYLSAHTYFRDLNALTHTVDEIIDTLTAQQSLASSFSFDTAADTDQPDPIHSQIQFLKNFKFNLDIYKNKIGFLLKKINTVPDDTNDVIRILEKGRDLLPPCKELADLLKCILHFLNIQTNHITRTGLLLEKKQTKDLLNKIRDLHLATDKLIYTISQIIDLYLLSTASCCFVDDPIRSDESDTQARTVGRKERMGLFSRARKKSIQIDSVSFSAVSPKKFTRGKYLPINIVIYEEKFRGIIDNLMQSHTEDPQEVTGGYREVTHGSSVKVVLSSPEIAIEDDTEEKSWSGRYLNFNFALKIPQDFDQNQLLINANVYINNVIATRLKLIVDCDGEPKHNIHITRKDIESAFVSYASQDRARVASIIQGMKKARPDLDIFFDVESLRSGQKWEDALKTEIENRDVLFLCWSRHAKDSQWVDKEWRYALCIKGEDCIEPIPIDSPDVCPPPIELEKKHFNDAMLYIIKAAPLSDED